MEHLFWAMTRRCPNCGEGPLYSGLNTVAETCSACHVRFERWAGNWTIPVVMGYGSSALVGFGLIAWFQWRGTLLEHDTFIMAAAVVAGLIMYPLCKNLSLFMLWRNGFVFVDPPSLVEGVSADGDPPMGRGAPPPATPPA